MLKSPAPFCHDLSFPEGSQTTRKAHTRCRSWLSDVSVLFCCITNTPELTDLKQQLFYVLTVLWVRD